jgi:rhodanese-related sulfurtransferase
MTVKSISPQTAWQRCQENPRTLLIDVRSSMEFLFVGHPKTALNIAWIDEPDWDINPHFAAEIAHACQNDKTRELILICRSGVRSLEAGNYLLRQGFSCIYNVLEGFEGELDDQHQRSTVGGWRFHQLPWEQC